jgi:hypothetical protein
MRCYFLCDGRVSGIEILPLGLSDEDAIVSAHILSSKRIGPFDGFEVWDRSRFIFRCPPYAEGKRLPRRRPEGHLPFFQSFDAEGDDDPARRH